MDPFWLTGSLIREYRVFDDGIGSNLHTPQFTQLKYGSRSDPIPFATWKEAQLMIAEVEGGQEAVGIINMLRDYHGLPHFASADGEEIREQVLEERRRELWLQGGPTWRHAQARHTVPDRCHPQLARSSLSRRRGVS